MALGLNSGFSTITSFLDSHDKRTDLANARAEKRFNDDLDYYMNSFSREDGSRLTASEIRNDPEKLERFKEYLNEEHISRRYLNGKKVAGAVQIDDGRWTLALDTQNGIKPLTEKGLDNPKDAAYSDDPVVAKDSTDVDVMMNRLLDRLYAKEETFGRAANLMLADGAPASERSVITAPGTPEERQRVEKDNGKTFPVEVKPQVTSVPMDEPVQEELPEPAESDEEFANNQRNLAEKQRIKAQFGLAQAQRKGLNVEQFVSDALNTARGLLKFENGEFVIADPENAYRPGVNLKEARKKGTNIYENASVVEGVGEVAREVVDFAKAGYKKLSDVAAYLESGRKGSLLDPSEYGRELKGVVNKLMTGFNKKDEPEGVEGTVVDKDVPVGSEFDADLAETKAGTPEKTLAEKPEPSALPTVAKESMRILDNYNQSGKPPSDAQIIREVKTLASDKTTAKNWARAAAMLASRGHITGSQFATMVETGMLVNGKQALAEQKLITERITQRNKVLEGQNKLLTQREKLKKDYKDNYTNTVTVFKERLKDIMPITLGANGIAAKLHKGQDREQLVGTMTTAQIPEYLWALMEANPQKLMEQYRIDIFDMFKSGRTPTPDEMKALQRFAIDSIGLAKKSKTETSNWGLTDPARNSNGRFPNAEVQK